MPSKAGKIVYIPLIFMCGLILFPLIVTFTNSFMSELEIMLNYTSSYSIFELVDGIGEKFVRFILIPAQVTISQYTEVLLNQPSFIILLINSLKLTVPVVAGNLVISLMAAYAFTIWNYKHKEKIFFIYIVVMLMPIQAVLVPNYIVADILKIKDSYLAIILPGIFNPFGTFLLRQSMKSMPYAYIEAAKIDGAGDLYIFLHIIIPQMKTGIIALSMLIFIEYWNLVEQAIIFIKDYFREPLSVYLSRIAQGKMGIIFAASVVYMLPPLWFLLYGQKDLQKGIELSGVK